MNPSNASIAKKLDQKIRSAKAIATNFIRTSPFTEVEKWKSLGNSLHEMVALAELLYSNLVLEENARLEKEKNSERKEDVERIS
jgi:hypothetical protein